jgi:glyoxylate carboligase
LSDERVTLDLQLTYVEYGLSYCEINKYMNKQFIDNMTNIFKNTLNDMKKMGVLQDFQERGFNICHRAAEMGWELHLAIDFDEYFDF